jgi:hypothetical protein
LLVPRMTTFNRLMKLESQLWGGGGWWADVIGTPG